jgi:hypothetical protein
MSLCLRHTSWEHLCLETAGVSPTTGLLELPALGPDKRLCVAVGLAGCNAEMPHGLTGVLGPTEKDLQKRENPFIATG